MTQRYRKRKEGRPDPDNEDWFIPFAPDPGATQPFTSLKFKPHKTSIPNPTFNAPITKSILADI